MFQAVNTLITFDAGSGSSLNIVASHSCAVGFLFSFRFITGSTIYLIKIFNRKGAKTRGNKTIYSFQITAPLRLRG
jgi:hypothetical protein